MKTKNKKQITFLSLIILVMGGTIGAGIFFKNKTLSVMAQGHFGIVLATWGVGILAMLALAFAIVELTTAQKSDKGILEWVKRFSPDWFHKTSNNYIKWIFVPITMFTLPLYFANTLEDAGLNFGGEMGALGVAFAVFIYFMIANLISLRYSEISQWTFTIIKIIPLIALPIYGFINYGDVDGTIAVKNVDAQHGLTGASPYLAIIAGISAIAFAYDGFYAPASLRNEMKNPKSLGYGLAAGVLAISAVYLFLTIGFNVAGDGQLGGMKKYTGSAVYKMFNALIAVGILGIVNAYAMSSPRQYKDSANSGESPEIVFLNKLLFRNKADINNEKQAFLAGWLFVVITSTLTFVVLGPLGGYVYKETYGEEYAGGHLYQFSDVLTNFTSLLIFLIIAVAILGGLINRKTNKVKVEKSKLFIPSGIITVVIIFSASIYMIIESIVGMTGYNGADVGSNILLFIIFIAFILVSLIPGIWMSIHEKQKQVATS